MIYGDVYRPNSMTVDKAGFAQSLSTRPVKGMLTGPITVLQWSFVRDDQSRETKALQLALSIRDEVNNLQKAGLRLFKLMSQLCEKGCLCKK